MVEEDAKKKWCPMVRFHKGLDGDIYCSRPVGVVDDDAAKCIGSDCMLWKWDEEKEHFRQLREYSETEGHCGLVK
jgi:hypothetical protein